MLARNQGPDPPEPWTIKDVERWLLTPMRELRQGHSLVINPGNVLAPVEPDRPSATFDILAFARTVLGKGSDELTAVITWARIRAEDRDIDASIAEWCLAWGWSERSFHRRRKRGCERIAAAKTRADREKSQARPKLILTVSAAEPDQTGVAASL